MFKNLYQGKKIIISGATSGLGRTLALRYADYGGIVYGLGRNINKINSLNNEIKKYNYKNKIEQVDISDYNGVNNFVNNMIMNVGIPDVVIHNAAGNFICPFNDLSVNGFNRVNEIVCGGMFNLYQNVGRISCKRKYNTTYLHISTTYAETGSIGVIPSAVAKAGCDIIMKSLTSEWADYNQRLLGVAPGPIADTGGMSKLDPLGIFSKFNNIHNPRKKLISKEELSDIICFLTSDYSDYINGQVIRVDGGELNINSGEFNFLRYLPYSMIGKINK